MIQIIREFSLRDGQMGRFELAYGPGGAWSRVFSKLTGFRGLTLLRDNHDRQRYLSAELWESESDREQALQEHKQAHADLQDDLSTWAEAIIELGVFEPLPETFVRPRPTRGPWKSRRHK